MPAATRPADLRMGLVGLAAWAGGLLVAAPGRLLGAGAGLLAVLLVGGGLVPTRALRRGRRRSWTSLRAWRTTALACLLAMLAVLVAGLVRADRVAGDPVASLASEGAAVTGRLVVSTDPRPMAGARSDGVFLRAVVVEVSGRGTTWQVRSPVLVLAPASWADVRLGSTVALAGRLQPTEEGERSLAAMLSVHGEPVVLEQPGAWWRATEVLRASLRAAVAHRPAPERVLVPALVAGDDAGLDPRVAEEFRATGLTHLLAVSGTNLTLLLGALLVLARLVGVRGRGLLVLGLAGVVGFVLLARTEPSVLRAAVMGVVGLLALTHGGGRAVRGLGVAVTVLLLVDPTLATAPGFALSVLATGGIVLLGPRWRDALARWLPRWLAEAIAVPTAAQLACTPVVAALSGQVSLVAVVANLLAAPAVGPATVLGLLGGCVGLVWPWAGRLLGTVATWCVGWIVEVAHRGAGLPTAAVDWSTSGAALAALTALTVVLAWRGATSGRETPWCSPPPRVMRSWSTSGPSPGRSAAASTTSGCPPSTSSSSRTSTPTTWTGCRRCSGPTTSARSGSAGCSTRPTGRGRCSRTRPPPAYPSTPRRTPEPGAPGPRGCRCSGRPPGSRAPVPGTGRRRTTPAWCCWSRSPACGCCSPAIWSLPARQRWHARCPTWPSTC